MYINVYLQMSSHSSLTEVYYKELINLLHYNLRFNKNEIPCISFSFLYACRPSSRLGMLVPLSHLFTILDYNILRL